MDSKYNQVFAVLKVEDTVIGFCLTKSRISECDAKMLVPFSTTLLQPIQSFLQLQHKSLLILLLEIGRLLQVDFFIELGVQVSTVEIKGFGRPAVSSSDREDES